ncbi:hypothetical protein [Gemmobacter sp. 24YEA27]|uniref:hypothetical protein n=1 Tax=Gemmobacter sp. 24YEA27 TaxID=3040672 RepID=UPI0024B3BB34|nr:hypothetical protein [Gemmobacter sp. 24YEA27]
MIAVWPSSLPRPERDSWQRQSQEARRKTQADMGPPRYRRRFSGVPKLVTLSVLLDRNQRAVFDNFFEDACAQGALRFWMPDPTTEGWSLLTSGGAPLLTSAGVPILMAGRWLCAWGDQLPVETVVGIEFRKSFSIVVLP